MSLTWLLLNAAYAVYTFSGVFKDMFKMRVVLLAATALFIVYGIQGQVWSVVWWSLPVAAVHSWNLWLLLKARRGINLTDEDLAVRTLLFPELDRVAFNALWHCGEERTVVDEVLIIEGSDVQELLLILDGEVDVEMRGRHAVRLSALRMVGEMSSLNNSAASATVTARDTVRLRVWGKESLAKCSRQHPSIEVAVLRAMGQEVARKLT